MRKVILYISTSIDGYIADRDGGVSWIDGCGLPEDLAGSYERFVKDIDTVVMGWNTYHQIVTELSPDRWVYEGMDTYVITHRDHDDINGIHFTCEPPCRLIRQLKEKAGKDIWICGGASVVNQLMDDGLVDMLHLTILPVMLGSGIRLFNEGLHCSKYSLIASRQYGSAVELIYMAHKPLMQGRGRMHFVEQF